MKGDNINGRKKEGKISLSTLLLILSVIVIIVMSVFMFKMYDEKTSESNKVAELSNEIYSLNEKVKKLDSNKEIDTVIDKEISKENLDNSSDEIEELQNKNVNLINEQDLYGVYFWQKNFTNEYGSELNLKNTLVLNSDGSAQYMASSGYEVETTIGSFLYQDGKIEYTDQNEKVETFIVIDKDTLQNTYYNETTKLTKTQYTNLTSSSLSENDVLFITEAINNSDGTYKLNGILYKHDDDNNNEAQISDRWILTNKCYTITVSKALKCNMNFDYDDKYNTVDDVFNNYQSANPEITANPDYTHCFNFKFENNKCVSMGNILTGGI